MSFFFFTSVVQENDETLFSSEAPSMFCGQQKPPLTFHQHGGEAFLPLDELVL